MITKKVILIVVGGLIIIGGSFYILNQNEEVENSAISYQFEDTTENTDALILGEGYARFTHPEFGFSVEYPKELEVTAFEEEEGAETIVFSTLEDPSVALEDKVGFQIFVSPFEEELVLTLERIREDLPFAKIEEPVNVVIGTKTEQDIQALLFLERRSGHRQNKGSMVFPRWLSIRSYNFCSFGQLHSWYTYHMEF